MEIHISDGHEDTGCWSSIMEKLSIADDHDDDNDDEETEKVDFFIIAIHAYLYVMYFHIY